jgi:hypothetical protein
MSRVGERARMSESCRMLVIRPIIVLTERVCLCCNFRVTIFTRIEIAIDTGSSIVSC